MSTIIFTICHLRDIGDMETMIVPRINGNWREELDWQDADGHWARVLDYSRRGVSFEGGLLLDGKRFSFSAGCAWIAAPSLTLGAGVRF